MFEKPGIKAEIQRLDARDGELRSASRTMYALYRKDLSYRPDLVNIAKTRYFGVQTFRLNLGRMHDFEEGSMKFREADEKAGIQSPSVVYEVLGGASEGTILIFEPMESLKTMDQFAAWQKAVQQEMGEEYQQFADLHRRWDAEDAASQAQEAADRADEAKEAADDAADN